MSRLPNYLTFGITTNYGVSAMWAFISGLLLFIFVRGEVEPAYEWVCGIIALYYVGLVALLTGLHLRRKRRLARRKKPLKMGVL